MSEGISYSYNPPYTWVCSVCGSMVEGEKECMCKYQRDAAKPEPEPHRGGRSVTILVAADLIESSPHPCRDHVILDLVARDKAGFERYGQNLETNDGRNTLMDAYQEALDLAQYLRKLIEEGSVQDRVIWSSYNDALGVCLSLAGLLHAGDDR